jgi:hypothetical protein
MFKRLAVCGAGVHLLRALVKRQSIGFWFQSLVSRQSSQQLQRPSIGLTSGQVSRQSRLSGSQRQAVMLKAVKLAAQCITMRSSGPRGETSMFPETLSARGRLTRR